jgi:protein CpxP
MYGMKMFKGLDLTDAQKAQIEQLTAAHRQTLPDKTVRAAHREELKTLLQAPTFDEAGVRVLLEKQQDQRLDMEIAQLKFQHQLRAVLTPEQQAKLDERQAKVRHKMREKAATSE